MKYQLCTDFKENKLHLKEQEQNGFIWQRCRNNEFIYFHGKIITKESLKLKLK